jgi:hypothetical protein
LHILQLFILEVTFREIRAALIETRGLTILVVSTDVLAKQTGSLTISLGLTLVLVDEAITELTILEVSTDVLAKQTGSLTMLLGLTIKIGLTVVLVDELIAELTIGKLVAETIGSGTEVTTFEIELVDAKTEELFLGAATTQPLRSSTRSAKSFAQYNLKQALSDRLTKNVETS